MNHSLQKKTPIILASASRARNEMLQNAGVIFKSIPADINEDIVFEDAKLSPQEKALELSKQKALSISKAHPDHFVIGSDQILEADGTLFQKAKTRDEAREKLKTLSGKTHHLISSVAIAKNNQIIWDHTDIAKLTMHALDNTFLESYLNAAKDDILSCVGAYAFESHGAWLFKEIDANYFTILGMPLLPLLDFLRTDD